MPEQMPSRSGRTDPVAFGDGEYPFYLGIDQLRELQEKCGEIGPPVIFHRLSNGAWLVDDVYQTIRLGLIGGGLAAAKALKLANRYAAPPTPYAEIVPLAALILGNAILGGVQEPLGKEEAGENPPPTDELNLPPSTG